MNTVFLVILFYLNDGNLSFVVGQDKTHEECMKLKKEAENTTDVSEFEHVEFICTDKKGLIEELNK